MASSSGRKGGVKTLEWWKHLRWRKKGQNKLVREDGKKQIRGQVYGGVTEGKRKTSRTDSGGFNEG